MYSPNPLPADSGNHNFKFKSNKFLGSSIVYYFIAYSLS